MNFEKNITDKCNTTVHPCSYDLSNHTVSIHMTFIGDARAPLWSKGQCHVISQRWGWWEWGYNLCTIGAYSWPGDDWSTILSGEKGVLAGPLHSALMWEPFDFLFMFLLFFEQRFLYFSMEGFLKDFQLLWMAPTYLQGTMRTHESRLIYTQLYILFWHLQV